MEKDKFTIEYQGKKISLSKEDYYKAVAFTGKEVWKDIEGFEGLYQVSNLGRVKSLEKKVRPNRGSYVHKERIMTSNCTTHRYRRIILKHNGKKTCRYIHRLVAQAFIPNPENKPQINHKNGDRYFNHVSNLEWCNQNENMIHSYAIGLRTSPMKGVNGGNHPASTSVIQICPETNKIINKFDSLIEAANSLGVNNPRSTSCSISSACSGKYHTAAGFKWKYADE